MQHLKAYGLRYGGDFVAFVKASGLTAALRQITPYHASAEPFARGYNGPGYKANEYHVKIARAFAKWSKA